MTKHIDPNHVNATDFDNVGSRDKPRLTDMEFRFDITKFMSTDKLSMEDIDSLVKQLKSDHRMIPNIYDNFLKAVEHLQARNSELEGAIAEFEKDQILYSGEDYIDFLEEVEGIRQQLTEAKAELEAAKKCCTQRGARMQILFSQVKGTNYNNMVEEMDKWFDKDGVPL